MTCSKKIDTVKSRIFRYAKTSALLLFGLMLLVVLGCNVDPKALDLGKVHPTEQSAVRDLYDGIASFTIDNDGHVHTIRYDFIGLELANSDAVPHTFGDTDMAAIAKLTKLKRLDLPMTHKTSDQGMKDLASLTELEVLVGHGFSEVTSDGFRRLASLRKLKALSLGGSPIDDSGLAHLSELHELEFLDLTMTNVTDKGARHLQHLENLKTLTLVSTSISDASLNIISQLPGLEELDLAGCNVTDAGLGALSKLPRLRRLVLATSNGAGHITDKGIDHLKSIKTLEHVHLAGNPVSEAGAASLRSALPNCEVELKYLSVEDAP